MQGDDGGFFAPQVVEKRKREFLALGLRRWGGCFHDLLFLFIIMWFVR